MFGIRGNFPQPFAAYFVQSMFFDLDDTSSDIAHTTPTNKIYFFFAFYQNSNDMAAYLYMYVVAIYDVYIIYVLLYTILRHLCRMARLKVMADVQNS